MILTNLGLVLGPLLLLVQRAPGPWEFSYIDKQKKKKPLPPPLWIRYWYTPVYKVT